VVTDFLVSGIPAETGLELFFSSGQAKELEAFGRVEILPDPPPAEPVAEIAPEPAPEPPAPPANPEPDPAPPAPTEEPAHDRLL
jgi:hypothetical protein